jgi:DNA-binding CsgD family transcriptional regulator
VLENLLQDPETGAPRRSSAEKSSRKPADRCNAQGWDTGLEHFGQGFGNGLGEVSPYQVEGSDSLARRPALTTGTVLILTESGYGVPADEVRSNLQETQLGPSVFPNPTVFRGRTAELESIMVLLRTAARTGQGAVMVVSGEPGIGKSALFGEAAARARNLGFLVGIGKAEPLEQIAPLAPLLVALRSGSQPLLSDDQFAELGGLSGQPLWLVDRLTSDLEECATRAPVLLVIDDLQWADRLTVFALRVMPGRLAGSPIIWVLTTRPDPGGPAQEVLEALGQEVVQKTVALDPLRLDELELLAEDRLGKPVDGGLRRQLAGAGGNPFLALELASGVAAALTTHGGEVVTRPTEATDELPTTFVAAVRSRLASLPTEVVRLLEVGSVLGSAFTVASAAALLGTPRDSAVLAWLEEATRADVLVDDGEHMTFRHDLLRQAVYENISPSIRKALHRRAAEFLLANGRSPVDAASHVLLSATSGDTDAVEVLRRAAQIVSRITPSVSVELIERAFDLLTRTDPSWVTVGKEAIDLLDRASRSSRAVDIADTLLGSPLSAVDRAEIQLLVARPLWQLGQLTEIGVRVDGALLSDDLPVELRARLDSVRALSSSRDADLAAALLASEAALARAQEVRDVVAQVTALHALGEVAKNDGRYGAAIGYFRHLDALSPNAGIIDEITCLQLSEQYDRSQAVLEKLRVDLEAEGDASLLTAVTFAHMWESMATGLLDNAETDAVTLLQLCEDLQEDTSRSEARCVLARVAQLRGDLDAARSQLVAARDHLRPDDSDNTLVLKFSEMWIAESAGDLASAVVIIGQVLRPVPVVRSRFQWNPAWLMSAARIAALAGDLDLAVDIAERAEALAERNRGVATIAGVAVHARALVSGDIDMLAKGVELLRDSQRPFVRADAVGDYGAVLLHAGQRQAGIAALDEAWDIFTEFGAQGDALRVQRILRTAGIRRRRWMKGSPRPLEGWDSLTPMEQKVAIQVARGDSNRTAAAALFLSPHTVASHLRTTFVKLNVKSRTQLAAVVLRHLETA